MSHCTNFDFQYSSRRCIIQTFENMGLIWRDDTVVYYNSGLEKMLGINGHDSAPAIVANKDGFNYFMIDKGNHYELSIEKHNMSVEEEEISKKMANEFKHEYVKTTVEKFKKKLERKGIDCILKDTPKGWEICFGAMYEKSIFVKLNKNKIEEQVSGVKGKSCSSLTGALEDMLSSSDVDLNTRWTEEYYQTEDDELKVYNLE
ncbi:MAG: DUF2997 domain-containing protein [Alphaproteobacteria bacterium]|nr:DUF2997 domain-containing protein [Alphaproteobacteria bacterium]